MAAAAACLLVIGAVATQAVFTDNGNVETNFSSGTLNLKFDAAQDGNPTNYQVTFSAGFDTLAPGDSVTYDLLVYNSGNVPATASLAAPTITNTTVPAPSTTLESALTLDVTDVTGGGSTALYTGPLIGANFTGLDISASGPGTGRTLRLTATLPSTATTAVAGQSITVVLPFSAVQS